MKNIITIITLLFICTLSFGQDYSYKENKYDLKIFDYLMEKIQKESTSLSDFLEFSKPFSKWDIRPLKAKKVWAMDAEYSASTIPNFIWGSFSNFYNIDLPEAKAKPNDFLQEGIDGKTKNSEFFNLNLSKFKTLTEKLLKSSNSIFLNQNSIQRIDNIYNENSIYWNYLIPTDSPYPLSDRIETLSKKPFNKEQKNILELLSQLKIYAAYKFDNGIFLLINGFTDNSYGYFYNPKGVMEMDNNLFQIMKHEKLGDNFFYYIAN